MKIITTLSHQLQVWVQYALPQRGLSRLAGCLMQCQTPWVAQGIIKWFIKRYGVDLTQAQQQSADDYSHFNAFFTRALLPAVRPIAQGEAQLVSPADGAISQVGAVEDQQLLQAKGHYYRVADLLAHDKTLTPLFSQGAFATVYLSPKDYHRVHMPLTGRLIKMCYVPGKLFSVSPLTAQHVPNVFARNERVICFFETAHGVMAVIMVGAMLVASIATVWAGIINPKHHGQLQTWDYQHEKKCYQKGEEIGHFQLGSTVIVLTQHPLAFAKGMCAGSPIKMGEALAAFQ